MKLKYSVVIWYAGSIWGIFNNERKAKNAISLWKLPQDWTMEVFATNYRLKTVPPKYLSDDNG